MNIRECQLVACGYFLFDVSLVCRDLLVLLGEHTCSTKCKLAGATGPTRTREGVARCGV